MDTGRKERVCGRVEAIKIRKAVAELRLFYDEMDKRKREPSGI